MAPEDANAMVPMASTKKNRESSIFMDNLRYIPLKEIKASIRFRGEFVNI